MKLTNSPNICVFIAIIVFFIGCLRPGTHSPPPDDILRVGDKLQHFTFHDVTGSNGSLKWIGGKYSPVTGGEYGPGVIVIPEKGTWIEIKEKTRYVCATQDECIISSRDYTIIKGTIEVYHRK